MKIVRWKGSGGFWQISVAVAKMAKVVMIINKAFWLGENNEGKGSLVRVLRLIIMYI